MTKHDLLSHLQTSAGADANDIASIFGLAYPAAAMALLRLARQGLALRLLDPETGTYWYRINRHGKARLAWLDSVAARGE